MPIFGYYAKHNYRNIEDNQQTRLDVTGLTNTYKVLVGAEAFVNTLNDDLKHCNDSLYVQFMTYEGDTAGKLFSAPLKTKANAGVDVRLIVDYYSDNIVSDIFPTDIGRRQELQAERTETINMFADMQSLGVKLKRTAPFGLFWQYGFFRDHKKMVILDERVAYIGGINISDHNFAWHDYMVRIEGTIVSELVRDFCATWNGESMTFDKTLQNGDYVLNQSAGREAVYDEILAMIDRAEHTILIEAPYIVGDKLENALLKAAKRGVTITLILPSNVNKAVFRWWLPASMRKLNHPNITFYGFQGHGGMTHAKLYLFDDKWATFGSLNVFELECMMQKEINIFSTNPDLIDQLKHLAQADLAQSTPLITNARGGLRFTHTLAHIGYSLWIEMLIKNPRWRKKYC